MSKEVYCVSCKKVVPVQKQDTESLTEHATLNGHLLYCIENSEVREKTNICCEFCKNRNMMILGYSTRVKKYVCIRCIAEMENFSSFLNWKDTYVSWFPYVLSYNMVAALEAHPVQKGDELAYKPNLYPILMNHQVLYKLSEIIAEKGGEEIQSDYVTMGYGWSSTCIRVHIPTRESHNQIMPSCCLQVSFDGASKKEDAVVIMCQQDYVTLVIRNLNHTSINQNGKCTLFFPTSQWIDVSFFSTAGFLLQDHVKNSMLLNRWMGHGINLMYRYLHLTVPKFIHLNKVEYQHLANSIKNLLDVIECGDDPVRQTGEREEGLCKL